MGGNCLSQSIALTAAMARAGQEPTLVLGCRRYPSGEWGAHAWVLLDDKKFDPLPSGSHQSLARLSAATNWVPAEI